MRSALPPKIKQRNAERFPKLQSFQKKIERPMLVLCFVWLCVLLIELVNGPNPILSDLGNGLWIVFVAYFLIRLFAAANRKQFLKKTGSSLSLFLFLYSDSFRHCNLYQLFEY